jgi:RNA polymerase sigma factor (sigma-70 family)
MVTNEQLFELVHKFNDGDKNAFESILNKMRSSIYKEAHKYKNLLPSSYDFEDLAQVGMLEVWKSLSNIKDDRYLFSYFYGCIRCSMLKMIRSEKALKRKSNYRTISLDAEIVDYDNDKTNLSYFLSDNNIIPFDSYLTKQGELNLIKDSKNKLSKRERKAFDLWSKGFEASKIAILTGCSITQTYNSLQKSKAKIRRTIENVPS